MVSKGNRKLAKMVQPHMMMNHIINRLNMISHTSAESLDNNNLDIESGAGAWANS